MARKLNSEEQRLFQRKLQQADLEPFDLEDEKFLHSLDNKREAELALTPELNAWFGEWFPPRSR